MNDGKICALTSKEVCAKLKKKKSWLWDRLKRDPHFPKPIYLSPGGAPIWLEHQVDQWLLTLAQEQKAA